jgi:hypothetical protein
MQSGLVHGARGHACRSEGLAALAQDPVHAVLEAAHGECTSSQAPVLREHLLDARSRLPLLTSGAPLPTIKNHGVDAPARTFIATTTGASLGQVDHFKRMHDLIALAAQRPGGCPMQLPVTGRIDGRPWREHLDFGEASELMRHLGTAAMIICLYLTGMRPQEKRAELHLMKHSTLAE